MKLCFIKKKLQKKNEENEVKVFLEHSIEFQKIKLIANKPGMENAKRHLSYLEQCKSFYELKQACSDKGCHFQKTCLILRSPV